jgi:hypothetical protein
MGLCTKWESPHRVFLYGDSRKSGTAAKRVAERKSGRGRSQGRQAPKQPSGGGSEEGVPPSGRQPPSASTTGGQHVCDDLHGAHDAPPYCQTRPQPAARMQSGKTHVTLFSSISSSRRHSPKVCASLLVTVADSPNSWGPNGFQRGPFRVPF